MKLKSILKKLTDPSFYKEKLKGHTDVSVYLDNNATTQIDEKVEKEIISFIKRYGNPSSLHTAGLTARKYVDEARRYVAELINAEKNEIIFTSGGTEANNTILKGVANHYASKGNHIITSKIEHSSIIESCQYLEKQGFKVTYLPVNSDGLIDLNDLEKSITNHTILISIMFANNEVGSIQHIRKIAEIAKNKGVLCHTDAVQGVGKMPVDVKLLDVDFLTYSSHKIYGPKGVGAMYIKSPNKFDNLIHGGHQESFVRGGTENTIGIVGFGEAARVMIESKLAYNHEIKRLRTLFELYLHEHLPQVKINGPQTDGLPGTINLQFPGIDNKKIIALLDYYKIYASTGSACSEGGEEASHVLKAIGLTDKEAGSSVRFSIGKFNNEKQIKYCVDKLKQILSSKGSFDYIYIKDLNEELILNPEILLVDIRNNLERQIAKTITKAIEIDLFEASNYIEKLEKNKKIVLICQSGVDATILGYNLSVKGFTNVMVLLGGYLLWKGYYPNLYGKYAKIS